jgi:hypothetical protein
MPEFVHTRSLVFSLEMAARWRGSSAERSATLRVGVALACTALNYVVGEGTAVLQRVFRYRDTDAVE